MHVNITLIGILAVACLVFSTIACNDDNLLPPGTLAVSVENPKGSDIYLIDILTQSQTKITERPGTHSDPVFSPDWKNLLYLTRNNGQSLLNLYSLDTNTTTELPFTTTSAASWGPDGKTFLFFCDNKICSGNSKAEIVSQWAPEEFLEIMDTVGPPSKSAKSGDIVFVAKNAKDEIDIYVVNQDWKNLRRILYNRTSKYMPPLQNVDAETLEKRLDARRITGNESYPVWAPEENKLLMISDYDHYKKISQDLISKSLGDNEINFTDIYLVDLTYAHLFTTYEGKKELREKTDWPPILTKLTRDQTVEGPPTWSSDGLWSANTFTNESGETLVKLILLSDANTYHEISVPDLILKNGAIAWSN